MPPASSKTAPPSIPTSTITLPSAPTAPLTYHFTPSKPSSPRIIIFLNGLGLPASSWDEAIRLLSDLPSHPALLSYDRYGQGASKDSRDPRDEKAEDPEQGHDIADVVSDLHSLIHEIWQRHLSDDVRDKKDLDIVFVGNSIGCSIARLYAQTYPDSISGLLLLDSMVANSDFVSQFPDPEAADFDPSTLPPDVTVEDIRHAREIFAEKFHPDTGSMGRQEGLWRGTARKLLPWADRPKLQGKDGKGVWLTVVGHDPESYAEESEKGLNIPQVISKYYSQPWWEAYGEGLTRITDEDRSGPLIVANGCGHFIQRDDPEFVVEEVKNLLTRMKWLSEE